MKKLMITSVAIVSLMGCDSVNETPYVVDVIPSPYTDVNDNVVMATGLVDLIDYQPDGYHVHEVGVDATIDYVNNTIQIHYAGYNVIVNDADVFTGLGYDVLIFDATDSLGSK